jgi:hypothetical protein
MRARCERYCGRCKRWNTQSLVRQRTDSSRGERVVKKMSAKAELINIAPESVRGQSTSAHSKKFARGSSQHLRLLFRRKFFHRFDELAWVRFAEREWVVRSERDALRAK